jgi:hypothetical protein
LAAAALLRGERRLESRLQTESPPHKFRESITCKEVGTLSGIGERELFQALDGLHGAVGFADEETAFGPHNR